MDNDRKKQEETIDNLKLMKEVEGDNDKREINNLKRKLSESKHIVDELKERIKCPVCLEIPQTGPVSVCPNGHLVCNECKKRVGNACPTCRVAMGEGKSLLAVTVIENIDHQCKFVDCGEFFSHEEIEKHSKVCCQRTVSCPHSSCNVKVGLSKLLDHFRDCSFLAYRITLEQVSAVKTLYFTPTNVKGKKDWFFKLRAFTCEDISFCLKVEKRDWLYNVYLVMLATEEECSEYKSEMTVHGYGCDALSDDSVAFNFWGKPCSIDVDEKEWVGVKIDEKGMKQILSKSWSKSGSRNKFSVSFSIGKIPTLLTTM
eukprot:GFUD01006893.1.p1 GENE.GFUD01006893.1~~GFUD01006893.1.p1  ORF type:complete len:314 (-),score=53.64 GFUD01006893.1:43-984(-)